MQRIFVSALVAPSIAACAASFLTPSSAYADSQPLDPGWQLAYAGQPEYGGTGGVIQYMFGDGGGQPVIARAYQPAPTYYQSAPAPQPSRHQPAPVYYQQEPAPQPPAYQQPTPAYYQQVPAPQTHAYQPAPTYYQQVPAPQTRAYQPAPVYYRQVPAQQARTSQPPPVSYQQVPPPQPPGYGPQSYGPASAQQPSSSGPQYTGSVPPQQARSFQTAPVNYQTVPAPQQSAYQPAVQNPQPAPPRQLAFGYPAQQQQQGYGYPPAQQQGYGYPPPQQPSPNYPTPGYAPSAYGDMAHPTADPRYERQIVDYQGDEKPGAIIIDTPHFFLYLVLDGGKALRYGIGVGRPGFTWAGVKEVSAMREWPDWHPPVDMLERRPDLPRYMPGGPDNPLGARALYLGSTLYRIHGSNEPWSIGTQVSSGCIRLRNADIIDLYARVKVGTKVIVI